MDTWPDFLTIVIWAVLLTASVGLFADNHALRKERKELKGEQSVRNSYLEQFSKAHELMGDSFGPGDWVFGNLMYISEGIAINPSELSFYCLESNQCKLVFSHGTELYLNGKGALCVARAIVEHHRGRKV